MCAQNGLHVDSRQPDDGDARRAQRLRGLASHEARPSIQRRSVGRGAEVADDVAGAHVDVDIDF